MSNKTPIQWTDATWSPVRVKVRSDAKEIARAKGYTSLLPILDRVPAGRIWPLPNVWLGVSVEDQQRADERIPLLLQTPAAVRFLSCEPLLGPVDLGLNRWVRLPRTVISELPFPPIPYVRPGVYRAESNPHGALSVRTEAGELLGIKPDEFERLPTIDWPIVGGESGPGARVCRWEWVASIVRQCAAAGVPCFVKQLGSHVGSGSAAAWPTETVWRSGIHPFGHVIPLLRNRKGGSPEEWPSSIRVRQFPKR